VHAILLHIVFGAVYSAGTVCTVYCYTLYLVQFIVPVQCARYTATHCIWCSLQCRYSVHGIMLHILYGAVYSAGTVCMVYCYILCLVEFIVPVQCARYTATHCVWCS
jgi:multisubunit Na+/H+ antiporter MnhF subunit